MRLNTKLLSLLLLFATLVSSCNKDSSDDNSYYFKFKLKGNWVTWKNPIAEIGTQSGETHFAISTGNENDSESLAIGIKVNNTSFGPGTYTPDNSFMSLLYIKDINSQSFNSYSGGGFLGGGDTRYEITITSVTNKEVKGSFTGSYLRNDSDDNDLLQITEGQFVVQRVP
jgi:hypothetical protein